MDNKEIEIQRALGLYHPRIISFFFHPLTLTTTIIPVQDFVNMVIGTDGELKELQKRVREKYPSRNSFYIISGKNI